MKEYDLRTQNSENSHGGDCISKNEYDITALHGKKKSGYIHTYIEFGLLIMKRMAREGNLATKAPQVKVNPKGKVRVQSMSKGK